MKCRWVPGTPGHHEGMVDNSLHSNHYFGDESNIIENDGVMKTPNVVKFEVQVTVALCNSVWSSFHIENSCLFQIILSRVSFQNIILIHTFYCCFGVLNSSSKLGRRSICLIFRGFRAPSFSSWTFVLLSLHNFVSFKARAPSLPNKVLCESVVMLVKKRKRKK